MTRDARKEKDRDVHAREAKRKGSRGMDVHEEETGPRKYTRSMKKGAVPTAGEEEAGNDVGESRLAGQSDAVVPRTRVGGMYMREARREWNPRNDS